MGQLGYDSTKKFRHKKKNIFWGTYGEWYRKRKILIKFFNFVDRKPSLCVIPLKYSNKNYPFRSIDICRTREKKQEEILESSMRSINASLIKKDNPVFYSRCGFVHTDEKFVLVVFFR